MRVLRLSFQDFFSVPSEVMIISYVRCWGGRVSLSHACVCDYK